MTMGTAVTFAMPQGWTLRQVATALARVWLPPFRAVPVLKAAPWMVQPIVVDPGEAAAPLWERGISTEEYEARLNRTGLCWSIRAKAGRSKGAILARLAMSDDDPATFQMVCSMDSFPETLFDAAKLAQFLEAHNTAPGDGLLTGLLFENGFQLASA